MQLSFTDISVVYDGFVALEGLSLDVPAGESLAIIGPSGCGKSTLLRLAAGLIAPTAGTVRADGIEIASPRQEITLILQDYGLLPWKNVFRNAELGLRIRGVPRVERETRTQAALEQVGLAGFEQAFPSELSGGMQQRLALARAIALDAQVLLMDEPLSALDAFLREELQEQLLELWLDTHNTQILVTHSIEEAVFLGKRIVVMTSGPGRIVACIDNPDVGMPGYRSSEAFFARCREVRAALSQAVGHES